MLTLILSYPIRRFHVRAKFRWTNLRTFRRTKVSRLTKFCTFSPGANLVLFRPDPISYFFAWSQFRTFSPALSPGLRPHFARSLTMLTLILSYPIRRFHVWAKFRWTNLRTFRRTKVSTFFRLTKFCTFSPGANLVLFRPEPILYFFARSQSRTFSPALSPGLRPHFARSFPMLTLILSYPICRFHVRAKFRWTNLRTFRWTKVSTFFRLTKFCTFSPGTNLVLFRPEPISYFFARSQFCTFSPALSLGFRPEFYYANSYTFVSYM
jgi:hypothetical protein